MPITNKTEALHTREGQEGLTIISGVVGIGATGAITTENTPGVAVTRVSEGLYRFTLDEVPSGLYYAHVGMMYVGAIPALAAESYLCTLSAQDHTTGIIDCLTTRPAAPAAIQTALVAIALVWANGTPVANDGGAAVQTAQDTAAQALTTTIGALEATVQDPESGSQLHYCFHIR